MEPSPVHIESVGLSKGITGKKSEDAGQSANLDLLLNALLNAVVEKNLSVKETE